MQTAPSASASSSPRPSCYADLLRALPAAELQARIAALSDDQADDLLHDWDLFSRADQRIPDGNWQTWLVLAGRGFGKTRTGAETVRQWVRRYRYVNVIAPTADDVRDIAVEGESGILAVCPNDER